ncbi:uncharacterized protein ARMOST_12073 [Armillaria ostoyae]|uniref:DUF6534 domain-containing protein n=1 Tax=Armillaria ostoyae TaxID=47428 RepID=A0A284RIX1_ARMOS|nr:uncharacterized protein ARMOST_12073 [Armillaria ostoyae]
MSETASTTAPDDTMGALLICTVYGFFHPKLVYHLISWPVFQDFSMVSSPMIMKYCESLHQARPSSFQGITVLCSWEYFVDRTKDRAINKVIVSVVCFIDTVHQIFITHALYMYLVKGFSDPAIMMRLLWSFLSQILLAALQGLLFQGWLFYLAGMVSQKNKILSAIIVRVLQRVLLQLLIDSAQAALVVGNFVVTLYYFGRSVHFKSLAELLRLKDIAELLVIGYSANILITASLLFTHFRKTTPGEQTDRIVDKFTLWVLNSGLLTSLVGVFCFITEVAWPQSLLSAAMYTILCRVYAVSVLTVLSSRTQLGPSSSNPPRLSNEIVSTGSRAPRFQLTKPGELAIHVECDTQMQYDNDIESPARPFPICFAWFTYKYL